MRRKSVKRGSYRVWPVATFEDLAAAVRERIRMAADGTTPADSGQSSLDVSAYRTRWTGSATLEEALEMVERGCQSGTDKLRALTDDYAYAGVQIPDWTHDVAGSRPCIPSFVAGVPDYMLVREDMDAERPRVRLVAKCNFHCGIDAEAPVLYSAALALTVDRLIADGHDVELVTIDSTDNCLFPVAVMPFGAPMDLSRLAFAVHPSFLRRVHFAFREADESIPVGIRSGGYGHPRDLSDERVAAAFPEHATSDVVTVAMPDVTDMEPYILHEKRKGGEHAAVAYCIAQFQPIIAARIKGAAEAR